jgi:predicted membrane GTPase involved in stress response
VFLGEFFIRPGDLVYKGMLVGECNRAQDMHINVAKTKKLTNMRSTCPLLTFSHMSFFVDLLAVV